MGENTNALNLENLGLKDDAELLTLVDSSLDCIKIVERDGTLSFMNSNGMCAMDVPAFHAIDGKTWSDLWPSESQAVIEDAVDRAMHGEQVRLEAFCPTALGRPRWWDVSVSPMVVDGEVQRLLSISRDITDRVRREQRAEERERLAIAELERAKRNMGEPDTSKSAPVLAAVGLEAMRGEEHREAARLRALESLALMDRDGSPQLQALCRMAAVVADAPTAMVSLVDEKRQVFTARSGTNQCGTDRDQSFCAIAIRTPDLPLVIEDAANDPRTRDNPMVTGDTGLRAYAGIPLVTTDGHALGALCVTDTRPRVFTLDQIANLKTLAAAVVAEIEREHLVRRATRLDLINAELKHRMGNTYAQVSSLVGLLAGTARDKAALAQSLRENITALSRTQARIAQGGWGSLDLCSLIEETVHASDPDARIDCRIEPNFDISPQAAFMLTLALQELATNSRKHGLLRRADGDGRVQLEIATDDETLALEWLEARDDEADSPADDTSTPSSGFGKKLLNRIVPLGLGGSSEFDISDEGMRYRLELPRGRVAAD